MRFTLIGWHYQQLYKSDSHVQMLYLSLPVLVRMLNLSLLPTSSPRSNLATNSGFLVTVRYFVCLPSSVTSTNSQYGPASVALYVRVPPLPYFTPHPRNWNRLSCHDSSLTPVTTLEGSMSDRRVVWLKKLFDLDGPDHPYPNLMTVFLLANSSMLIPYCRSNSLGPNHGLIVSEYNVVMLFSFLLKYVCFGLLFILS